LQIKVVYLRDCARTIKPELRLTELRVVVLQYVLGAFLMLSFQYRLDVVQARVTVQVLVILFDR